MASALYARAPARIRAVEEEAYANQNESQHGPCHARVHCVRAAPPLAGWGR